MLLGMVETPDSSDLEYMEGLYREFYPLMVSAANKYAVDPQDRDDVIQNALVCLVKKSALLRSLDRPVLASYIYRTVQHIAIDLWREREKAGQWEFPPGGDGGSARRGASPGGKCPSLPVTASRPSRGPGPAFPGGAAADRGEIFSGV